MKKLINLIDRLNGCFGSIASVIFLPILLITVFEVLARYLFRNPTIWAWDLNKQLFAALIMFSGGYGLLQGSHISVDVLYLKLSPRRRAFLDLLTSTIFFYAMLMITKYSWEMFTFSWKIKETMSTVWAPPYYTFRLLIPIGSSLCILQGISKFYKDLMILLAREDVS